MSNLPAVMEWLDAVGDMISSQKPVPAHIDPTNYAWVRDAVHECAPYLTALGLQPLDMALWTTDPVQAVCEARKAMNALAQIDLSTSAILACDIPTEEVHLARIRLKMMVDWINHVPQAFDFDKQEVTNLILRAMRSVHAVAWLIGIRPPSVEYERDPIGYMVEHQQFIEAWLTPTDGARH